VSLDPSQFVVATFDLPPASIGQEPVQLTDGAARESFHWAATERLDGLWCAAATAGALRMSDAALAAGRAGHLELLRRAVTCEATGAEAVSALTAAGVPSWLHKGIAVAQLDHLDPARRSFTDVDVLVGRDHLLAATGALQRAGFMRVEAAQYEWWERRFARSVVLRSADGVELDLHATVATGWFGEVLDHAALCRGLGDPVVLGGVTCRGLTPSARFLVSCYAAELSRGPGLRYLRDLAQQLLVTECDWRGAVRLAGHERGDVVVARALLRATATLRLDRAHPAVQWALEVRPEGRAARALEHAESAEVHGWRSDARSALMAFGPIDRFRFLVGVVVPPREVRASRGWALRDQPRRAARFLRVGR